MFDRLKNRRLVKWTLAYLTVAWITIQLTDVLADVWLFPLTVQQAVQVLLGFGFLITLVLAWYHGTPGRQRVSRFEWGLITGLVGIAAITIALVFARTPTETALVPKTSMRDGLPLVVMMDSHHPARVYDEETRAASGTNADVISDILLDLPIRRQRESIGPQWHRDEEILRFSPDLIIIHFSGFRLDGVSGPRTRLRLFIEFFAETDTKFLIYSRQLEAPLQGYLDDLLSGLEKDHPGLLDRVHAFGLMEYGSRKWRDPATSGMLKLRVKEILALQ